MGLSRLVLLTSLLLPASVLSGEAAAQAPYRLLATAESDDQVALIEFTPCTGLGVPAGCGARVARTYDVGVWAPETEGPHGVVPSADGRSFFVSLAHGQPFGFLQKVDLESGTASGLVTLGMFPATVDIARNGGFLWVVNFNFEDPAMAPSSVSVVDAATMAEVARTTTCRMPHGSRLNPQGTRHYSGCMMNDLLVEIDTRTFAGTRAFTLVAGKEGGVPWPTFAEASHQGMHGGMGKMGDMSNVCSPTWAQPSADGSRIFVACNKSAEIVEVDAEAWTLVRRWKTPAAPYNLAVTPDGKLLVVTQKGPGTVSIWRLVDGLLLADIPGTRKVASGVVVSADSRYAFATLEGVGGEPGTIDVIDLRALQKVASVEIGKQAGGIAMLP